MAALQARQRTVRKAVSFMQGRSGICIWRGVGTSDIRHGNCKPDNDKVGALTQEGRAATGGDGIAGTGRHAAGTAAQRRTSVVVRAAHVVAAAPADQLAAAALQTRPAVRTPLAGMLGSAIPLLRIPLLLDRLRLSGECGRHDGQPTLSPAGDSSGIRAHLIQCAVRQNHA